MVNAVGLLPLRTLERTGRSVPMVEHAPASRLHAAVFLEQLLEVGPSRGSELSGLKGRPWASPVRRQDGSSPGQFTGSKNLTEARAYRSKLLVSAFRRGVHLTTSLERGVDRPLLGEARLEPTRVQRTEGEQPPSSEGSAPGRRTPSRAFPAPPEGRPRDGSRSTRHGRTDHERSRTGLPRTCPRVPAVRSPPRPRLA